MKRYFLIFFAVFFFPVQFANAQLLMTMDAALNTLMQATGINQIIHYAQELIQWAETATRFKQQLEHMKFQVERAHQNLQSIQDVDNWSDFKAWYNRQLYYERMTMETFKKANIHIGRKDYSLYDLESIKDAVDYKYIDYWNREFTEEQNKEMWLRLGLTPSNYAYVQPFREKANNLAREAFNATEIQGLWYQRNMERNNERLQKLDADKNLENDDPNKLTEKEILMYMLESSQETNKVANDIAMNQAHMMEMQAAEHYLDQTPIHNKALSDWPDDAFGPLK